MKRFFVTLLSASLLALVSGYAAFAAQPGFSADFKATDAKGKVTTGSFFSAGDKIRQEMTTDRGKTVMILRLDKKVSWTLLPDNKYMETALTFDPSHPQAYAKNTYSEKVIGSEKVNGVVCRVIQITYKDRKNGVTIKWVPNKSEIPLKIQTKNAGGKVTSTTEFFNIKTGKQPSSLFEIPAGYEKFDLPFSF